MYEKNTSLIDSDINCRFEDLLCMTPDEFRSWVSKMRKLVIDIWDEQNIPPRQGKTEDEIYNFLSEKYGDWILYKPKFNYENFLLWSFPYLVLVFGGFIIVFLIKRRQKKT